MNRGAQGWQDEDPLDDTASHAPIIPPETLQGEDTVAGESPRSHQTEGKPGCYINSQGKLSRCPLRNSPRNCFHNLRLDLSAHTAPVDS